MTPLSEDDWETLEDTYEQVNLQEAIHSLDRARALLATDDEGKGLRSELLRLQTLAEQVIEDGQRQRLDELLSLAVEVDMQVNSLLMEVEKVQAWLEPLAYFEPAEEEDDLEDEDEL